MAPPHHARVVMGKLYGFDLSYIGDAILTCSRKLTWVSLIYRTYILSNLAYTLVNGWALRLGNFKFWYNAFHGCDKTYHSRQISVFYWWWWVYATRLIWLPLAKGSHFFQSTSLTPCFTVFLPLFYFLFLSLFSLARLLSLFSLPAGRQKGAFLFPFCLF